jgi:hypothetical protein
MAKDRKLHLDLHWLEATIKGTGEIQFEISGVTDNSVVHKILVKGGPDTIAHFAQELHKVLRGYEEVLARAKAALAGR